MEVYSDVRALEHTTLKVPYEILNKKYRITQKTIDREVSHVSNVTIDLEAKLMDKNRQREELKQLLTGLTDKLKTFKRKAEEGFQEEYATAQLIKKRVDHLNSSDKSPNKAGSTGSSKGTGIGSTVSNSPWKMARLDRVIVDYFLRNGYYECAIKLAKHASVEDLTSIDVFLVAREVEESLRRKETAIALAWCHDNKSKLRKMKSTFEFNLRMQEFIEMMRRGEKVEAIKHARKHFQCIENSEHYLKEIQKMMALLAFPTSTALHMNNSLFSEKRWEALILQFKEENYGVFQLSSYSVFSITLQSGLSVLKTSHCYKSDYSTRNTDCPVCSNTLNSLARHLPYSHSSRSRLVCYMSGEPLNELNPPMMLPNGYTYGENALLQAASSNKGKVTCPRTKQTFDIKDAEKVYVM